MEPLRKNSEILFLYDAMLTNPNGDPDDENKPRYDYDTQRNLVSDVRLKRYIRDYWINKSLEVFVSKQEGRVVTATEKVQDVLKDAKTKEEGIKKITEKFIDIKYFGATIPLKLEGREVSNLESISLTGPVQFTWGYSLHPTEILHSSTITSQLAGRESNYGTMGKDWRIKYSFIGFYGIVSAWRAKETNLTDEDMKNFDKDVIKAFKLQTTTRSKIGQTPRLYVRIEWKDSETFFGDLRKLVKVQPKTSYNPASFEDIEIDLSELSKLFEHDNIEKIYIWLDDEFKNKAKGLKLNLENSQQEKIEQFNI
ncbi:MAG: type I-B CRISPR-associated protein Cas7/Csh2 [Fervidobacterium sp.]|nr:type I-B CRISPR-associated protein Cas7/Csh2 [Fervidobacterium sp.]